MGPVLNVAPAFVTQPTDVRLSFSLVTGSPQADSLNVVACVSYNPGTGNITEVCDGWVRDGNDNWSMEITTPDMPAYPALFFDLRVKYFDNGETSYVQRQATVALLY
jgi:hypothetical protein